MLCCHIQKDQVRSNRAQRHGAGQGSSSLSRKAGALQSQPPAQVAADQVTPGRALQSFPMLQNTHSLSSSSGAMISTSHLGSSSTLICWSSSSTCTSSWDLETEERQAQRLTWALVMQRPESVLSPPSLSQRNVPQSEPCCPAPARGCQPLAAPSSRLRPSSGFRLRGSRQTSQH